MAAESTELMKNLLDFFNLNSSQLPLKVLHKPGQGAFLAFLFSFDNKEF